MTPRAPGTRTRRLRSALPLALAGTIAVGVFLLAATLVPVATAAPAWSADPVSWSNGLVLCQFGARSPDANISAVSVGESGLSAFFGGMSEVGSNGTTVAVTDVAGVVWAVQNDTTEDAYDENYSAVVPIVSAFSPAVVGTAHLELDFVLPAYAGSPEGETSTVTVALSVADWTWQGAGDHLDATFVAMPTFPTQEHLGATSETGWLLTSASNSSGQAREWMGASATATTRNGSGPATTVGVRSGMTLTSPSLATITVTFPAAGSFQSLHFAAFVGVVLPSTVAGIPTIDLVAVGAAAVAGSLGIAAVTRRVRSRPSRIIYVDDEEP